MVVPTRVTVHGRDRPIMKLLPKAQAVQKSNKMEKSARAPAQERNRHDRISKKERIAATLANLLTEDDIAAVVAVYRDGLKATQRFWQDNAWIDDKGRLRGKWVEVPDHKTRLACADMIAAYKEGLPVQRQAILVQKFESMDQTRERISHSPELLKAIGNLQKSGVAVEAGGKVIEIQTSPVQEPGGQKGGVASE